MRTTGGGRLVAASDCVRATAPFDCVVTDLGDGSRIGISDGGHERYALRRDDRWVATLRRADLLATGWTWTSALSGGDWTVRGLVDGQVVTETSCVAAGGDPVCSVEHFGISDRIRWTTAGISTFQVRRDGRWAATVDTTAELEGVWTGRAGDYLIRHRRDGQIVDTPCT